MNIVLTGFMGTGKTVVGRRLARRLGWRFVDVDRLIEQRTRRSIAEIFAEHGEAVFRRLEQRMIGRLACGRAQVIATGGGAFVDPDNRERLQATGPVICLTASPRVIFQRVGPSVSKRPLLAADPTVSRIERLMQQRASAYAKADFTLDTSRLSVDEVVARVDALISPWMSRSWQYLLKHSPDLCQRYAGKYVVVRDNRVVAVGTSHLKAYQRLRKPLPASSEVGIYYVPLPEESAVAL